MQDAQIYAYNYCLYFYIIHACMPLYRIFDTHTLQEEKSFGSTHKPIECAPQRSFNKTNKNGGDCNQQTCRMGPPKIATLRYKWLNYGLWMFMVDITIVNWVYKPTKITGGGTILYNGRNAFAITPRLPFEWRTMGRFRISFQTGLDWGFDGGIHSQLLVDDSGK